MSTITQKKCDVCSCVIRNNDTSNPSPTETHTTDIIESINDGSWLSDDEMNIKNLNIEDICPTCSNYITTEVLKTINKTVLKLRRTGRPK